MYTLRDPDRCVSCLILQALSFYDGQANCPLFRSLALSSSHFSLDLLLMCPLLSLSLFLPSYGCIECFFLTKRTSACFFSSCMQSVFQPFLLVFFLPSFLSTSVSFLSPFPISLKLILSISHSLHLVVVSILILLLALYFTRHFYSPGLSICH